MLHALHDESHDISKNLTPTLSIPRPNRRTIMSTPNPRMLGVFITILPCIFSSHALAAPFEASEHVHRQQQRDNSTHNSNNASIQPKIWIPILVVALVLVAIVILKRWKLHNIRAGLANFSGSTALASGTTLSNGQGTREVTAEQLAGATNRNATTDTGGTGTTGRPRRNRRPRRTPSQISTTSLPAYNKEPGDEELVIFRGPQDMEDAPIPTTIVMPSVDEDMEGSIHSRDNSQTSRYSPEPSTPHDMPLLDEDDESPDRSGQLLLPPGEDMPTRRSFDTLDSAEENMGRNNAPGLEPDPRGEAPPYFEVVDLNDDNQVPQPNLSRNNTSAVAEAPPSTPAPSTSPSSEPSRRRSGFRSLLHALGNPTPRSSVIISSPQGASRTPRGHTRADSGPSVISVDSSTAHGRDRSGSRASHRPSQSGSGSLINLSPFRTISRQKSSNTLNSNHLNSPSLISLNSISSPLSHTLVRTEFTYPKAGPTPEQLKLISSRETFARFGMPYGADAIAYAASASRQDLEPPPPDFDTPGSETHLPRSFTTANPSRLRADSSPESSDAPGTSSADHTEPTLNSPDLAPQPTAGPSNSAPQTEPVPSTTSAVAAEPTVPSSSTPSPPTKQTAPPTSFKVPLAVPLRSESRASSNSIQSFATAAETLPTGSESDSDLPSDSNPNAPQPEPETPTTPKLAGRHLLEPANSTVTQTETTGTAQT